MSNTVTREGESMKEETRIKQIKEMVWFNRFQDYLNSLDFENTMYDIETYLLEILFEFLKDCKAFKYEWIEISARQQLDILLYNKIQNQNR